MIGGATTSAKHTAVKIAPQYEQPTVHVLDASRACRRRRVAAERPVAATSSTAENREEQRQLVESYQKRQQIKLVPYAEAVATAVRDRLGERSIFRRPSFLGRRVLDDFPLDEIGRLHRLVAVLPDLGAEGQVSADLRRPDVGAEAKKLFDDARQLLDEIVDEQAAHGARRLRLLAGERGRRRHCDLSRRVASYELTRFHTLRQQWERQGQNAFLRLADFIAPAESGRTDYLGAFAVTTGHGGDELVPQFDADHDDYNSIMAKALADRLAEAFAELLHEQARRDWGYGRDEQLTSDDLIDEKYRGIRPAPGYPACPDHTEKRILFDLLDAEDSDRHHAHRVLRHVAGGERLRACTSPIPSRYFAVDRITRDQVEATPAARGCRRRSRALAVAESGVRGLDHAFPRKLLPQNNSRAIVHVQAPYRRATNRRIPLDQSIGHPKVTPTTNQFEG